MLGNVDKAIPKVAILLATFNGEKFLEQQLTSLERQLGVEPIIYVCDDGSVDGTIDILKSWSTQGKIREIFYSDFSDPSRVFFKLLKQVNDESYVAFCDQDDIWDKMKLKKLIGLIGEESIQLSFCARTAISWDGLEIKELNVNQKSIGFPNSLVENLIPGNTMVLNRKAVNFINSLGNENVKYYDSWIYLLISSFGICHYLPERLVSYRLHESNRIGLRKRKFRYQLESVENYFFQAQMFSQFVSRDVNSPVALKTKDFLSLFTETNYVRFFFQIIRYKLDRQKHIDGILFKVLVIILKIKNLIHSIKLAR
jgi:glycosyltransferase involved in cell wall biosynthesis